MTVLIATFDGLPDGEPGFEALDAALKARDIDFAWAIWDDPSVDWAAADLVAVRSTWDYALRPAEFLAWTRSLDQSRLLNGADVFEWNHDKAYLTDLGPAPDRADAARFVVGRVRRGDRGVRYGGGQASCQCGRRRPHCRQRPCRQQARPDASAAIRPMNPSAAPGSHNHSWSRCAPAARRRSSCSPGR